MRELTKPAPVETFTVKFSPHTARILEFAAREERKTIEALIAESAYACACATMVDIDWDQKDEEKTSMAL